MSADASTFAKASVDKQAGKPRVLSGMRPTGKLHLGHLVGALHNWVELQDEYDCFYVVVDWHALTSGYADTSDIVANGYDMVADWIAAGIDPEKSTIFVQSLVPEHAELFLLLSMVTPVPWLERVPTFKEQQEQLSEKDLSTFGFLGYPLLQAADIIIYNAQYVPVGEDQVAHLELTREVVRRFHNFYGPLFVEPQPLLTKFPRLPGLDNRKMSKSYHNAIDLADDEETIRKKVMQMYTDPKRVRADTPGTVEGNPVFVYHDAFNPDVAEVEDLKARYRLGKVGDVEVKKKLAAALNEYLEPMRARRAELVARPDTLRDILHDGSRKARAIAHETMERVRTAVRLKYS
ncbi:MAG: tryptophan--tRNA ligase [Vicinamibacterales bacterium]